MVIFCRILYAQPHQTRKVTRRSKKSSLFWLQKKSIAYWKLKRQHEKKQKEEEKENKKKQRELKAIEMKNKVGKSAVDQAKPAVNQAWSKPAVRKRAKYACTHCGITY